MIFVTLLPEYPPEVKALVEDDVQEGLWRPALKLPKSVPSPVEVMSIMDIALLAALL